MRGIVLTPIDVSKTVQPIVLKHVNLNKFFADVQKVEITSAE